MSEEFSLQDFQNNDLFKLEEFNFDKYITADDAISDNQDFDSEKSNYTRCFLAKLQEKNLIGEFEMGSEMEEVDQDEIIKLANLASPFKEDDSSGKIFYEVGGERVYLDMEADEVIQKRNVAELIPDCSINVIQNGILERAREAEAIYKVFVINKAYSGVWSALIKRNLAGYDAAALKPKSSDRPTLSFVKILQIMQEESSGVFRILVGACNLKISNLRTKKDLRLSADFTMKENLQLSELKIEILKNRVKFEKLINVEPTKAKREVCREQMVKSESDIIDKSPVGVLYRIIKLSSRNIPDVPYNKINRCADDLALQIEIREGLSAYPSIVADIKRKLKRRAYREFLFTYKMEMKELFRNQKVVNFDLKIKSLPEASSEESTDLSSTS